MYKLHESVGELESKFKKDDSHLEDDKKKELITA